jgi:hypothetical protein
VADPVSLVIAERCHLLSSLHGETISAPGSQLSIERPVII